MNKTVSLILHKLPAGGYVVQEFSETMGRHCQQLFASTSIEDSFEFMEQELSKPRAGEPVK